MRARVIDRGLSRDEYEISSTYRVRCRSAARGKLITHYRYASHDSSNLDDLRRLRHIEYTRYNPDSGAIRRRNPSVHVGLRRVITSCDDIHGPLQMLNGEFDHLVDSPLAVEL